MATAQAVDVARPTGKGSHTFCSDWMDQFIADLEKAMPKIGYKGLTIQGQIKQVPGIKQWRRQMYEVKAGATGNKRTLGIFGTQQEHAVVKVVFNDRTIIF